MAAAPGPATAGGANGNTNAQVKNGYCVKTWVSGRITDTRARKKLRQRHLARGARSACHESSRDVACCRRPTGPTALLRCKFLSKTDPRLYAGVQGDGSRYEGEWVDDMMTGRGYMVWADGRRYDGEWFENRCNGRGLLVRIARPRR
jgi:hypothetical protein